MSHFDARIHKPIEVRALFAQSLLPGYRWLVPGETLMGNDQFLDKTSSSWRVCGLSGQICVDEFLFRRRRSDEEFFKKVHPKGVMVRLRNK